MDQETKIEFAKLRHRSDRRLIFAWVGISVVGTWCLVLSLGIARTNAEANFQSPLDFKRPDVVELMDALCVLNPDLRCPNPYDLPGYFSRIGMHPVP